jgi:3-dehydroquinate dehydratase
MTTLLILHGPNLNLLGTRGVGGDVVIRRSALHLKGATHFVP